MKDMPTYLISKKDIVQSNYEKLKTDKIFIWAVPKSAENLLIPGVEWVIINSKKKEVFLAVVSQYINGSAGTSSETTKINNVEIDGDFIGRTFIKSDIIESYKFTKEFIVPTAGSSVGKVVLNLAEKHKTRSIAIRNALLKELPIDGKLYEFFVDEEEEVDDCIAYKEGNKWGFLFFTKKKNGQYEFKFEPIYNVGDNKVPLTQSQEGYKDFVYFIESMGFPSAIKIGRAENPTKRRDNLNGANPANIKILAIVPDGRKEKMYHEKFVNYKMYGKEEWFWNHEDIRKLIRQETQKYEQIKNLYIRGQK